MSSVSSLSRWVASWIYIYIYIYIYRSETWHNNNAQLEDTMTKLNIVPSILDEFHVTGMLEVWYLAKIGAVRFFPHFFGGVC
jgi:hypothetical protein